MNALVYDIEIKHAIPRRAKDGSPIGLIDGITYCRGWRDFAGMGVAVVGCYSYLNDQYSFYTEEALDEFMRHCGRHDLLVGYNNIPFDNRVLRHNVGLPEEIDSIFSDGRSYDLLREIWIAAGLAPEYSGGAHNGYSLNAMAIANGISGKTGSGELAPILWQQGERERVIEYCLDDVRITRQLVDRLVETGSLVESRRYAPIFPRRPWVRIEDGG